MCLQLPALTTIINIEIAPPKRKTGFHSFTHRLPHMSARYSYEASREQKCAKRKKRYKINEGKREKIRRERTRIDSLSATTLFVILYSILNLIFI
jgi:hypothetical protein